MTIKIPDILAEFIIENETDNVENYVINLLLKKNKTTITELEIKKNLIENTYFYVYAFLDKSKTCAMSILDTTFDYLPIYIGKGYDKRMFDLKGRNNLLIEKINKLKEDDLLEIKIIKENLKNSEALNLESSYIKLLGRLDNGTGILFNKNYGNKQQKETTVIDSELNLEKNKAILMLRALNSTKTIREAANKLNITERTLHRKIKCLNLKKNENNVYVITEI